MKRSRPYRLVAAVILLAVLAITAAFLNSIRFNPDPSSDGAFIARAQQKSAPGIKVSVSALGADESRKSFGEDLAKHNIQPVWLSIENETNDQLAFLPTTIHLTKFPTDSMAPCRLRPIRRVTNSFSSAR